MSLFIATLAFAGSAVLSSAKLGILGASLVAGVIGWAIVRSTGPRSPITSGSG
jgi:NhaA family Na+:H+ antiporter